MSKLLQFFLCFFVFYASVGQEITGTVTGSNGPLQFVNIQQKGTTKGTVSGEDGSFKLVLKPEESRILVFSILGYRQLEIDIDKVGIPMAVSLREDVLGLEQVVVTSSRSEVSQHKAPVIVNRIDSRMFESVQALSISEGLNFSPGLRMETNCSNCGFSQLRMNGLQGPYTQILINSRPVFSALAGVYGLEQIPANMVDRIEVVRGGGSVLFGGNAIAGTVNIITKDPIADSYDATLYGGFMPNGSMERSLQLSGTKVSNDLKRGLGFMVSTRDRDPFDANGDGYSELTKLKSTILGIQGYMRPTELSRFGVQLQVGREFRRGGNGFDRPPHQTDLAEQLVHDIASGQLSYERFSKDKKHKFSLYSALQYIDRESYYGAGGRIINHGDSLTVKDFMALNAYGTTSDVALATGIQYTADLTSLTGRPFLINTGFEHQFNNVKDRMPGYGRYIAQTTQTTGMYLQADYRISRRTNLVAGLRNDHVTIIGDYVFANSRFSQVRGMNISVPKVALMHQFSPNIKARMGYAQGYRAPQAFDEDLHVETVGGAAKFIILNPDLRMERSESVTASFDIDIGKGDWDINLIGEGFYTKLLHPFINGNQEELADGTAVVYKRNGSGALVGGVNLELRMAYTSRFLMQSGFTFQRAVYMNPETIWSADEQSIIQGFEDVTSVKVLRTPDTYGYINLSLDIFQRLNIGLSGIYTGRMMVPHVVGSFRFQDVGEGSLSEYTIIRHTSGFFEMGTKVSYVIGKPMKSAGRSEVFIGAHNILNSFQKDFDKGPYRDSAYMYGPSRPRTLYAGLKISF